MCGITGIYALNQIGRLHMINLSKATQALESRGPDFQGIYNDEFVGLGHRRLSIIDPSPDGHQPMTDANGRYHLIYNGEVYNFQDLRKDLQSGGVQFSSRSDTEVLLYLLIEKGLECLHQLNGFFAFAFYDSYENSLLLARDRFGIKPLSCYQDDDKFIFASELKAIFEYGIDKQLDYNSLLWYLRLNYLPHNFSMIRGVWKVLPGECVTINAKGVTKKRYYELDSAKKDSANIEHRNYQSHCEHISSLLEQSVTKRLYADVPLGSFLSGGIDSSIIAALAAKHTDRLHSFSIGYRDEPFFDETRFATRVSKHIGSEHTVFKLSNRDLFDHLFEILDYIDEPFADSSAIPTYILSKETHKHVTVALSGDGADELFGGYNKHKALLRLMDPGLMESTICRMDWLWSRMPKSRNGSFSNHMRQFHKFAQAEKLSLLERYEFLARVLSHTQVLDMLSPAVRQEIITNDQVSNFHFLKEDFSDDPMNDYLRNDIGMVLPNDMLTKVDSMSMANSLEVRVPFLDHQVVEYAMCLPSEHKVQRTKGKVILRDAFKDLLPVEIFSRKKHGFEVPLLRWFRRDLNSLMEELLSQEFLEEQGIFAPGPIAEKRRQIHSSNPGDVVSTLWALVVFQWWYRKYFKEVETFRS